MPPAKAAGSLDRAADITHSYATNLSVHAHNQCQDLTAAVTAKSFLWVLIVYRVQYMTAVTHLYDILPVASTCVQLKLRLPDASFVLLSSHALLSKTLQPVVLPGAAASCRNMVPLTDRIAKATAAPSPSLSVKRNQ